MEANSPLVRENCWEWYTSVVRTRMHNDSRELLVFTRWHEEDLIGMLRQREPVVELRMWEDLERVSADGWLALNFEALKTTPPSAIDPRAAGEALWPARHDAALLHAKRALDPLRFECMYQGRPSVREGLLYGDQFAEYDALPREIVRRANYTDTADTGDDYLCSMSYAVDTDGTIYVTDLVYSREGMEVTEGLVADLLLRSDTRTAAVESNNGGRGFARNVERILREKYRSNRCRIEWFHQGENKTARILTHATWVCDHMYFPANWKDRWPEFYKSMYRYQKEGKNAHDDAQDAATGVAEQFNKPSGWGFSSGRIV